MAPIHPGERLKNLRAFTDLTYDRPGMGAESQKRVESDAQNLGVTLERYESIIEKNLQMVIILVRIGRE